MGLCQCISHDNTALKTVDLKTLKNDLRNIENAPKNLIDKTSEISPLNELEHKQEKDNYTKPQQENQKLDNCVSKNANYIEANKPINTNGTNENVNTNTKANVKDNQIQDALCKDNNQLSLEHQQLQHPLASHQQLMNENISNSICNNSNTNETIKDSKILSTKKAVSRFENRTYINIVILGGKGVGKSAFVIKFIENVFEKLYIPTIGVEERRKKYSYNTHLYDLNFTVTSGNDYKSDYSKAYAAVDFFLVFYDITSMESFNEAKKILKSEVKNFVYSYNPEMTNVFLIGNKIDCVPRTVPEEISKTFCHQNDFQMFDISVKTNKNITTMMKALIKTVDDIAHPSE